MNWLARSWRRRLLFRSYLFLVAGLLIVASVLDAGFTYLQSSLADDDRWLEESFRLVEIQLAAEPPAARAAVAARLGREIGFGVQILSREDVAGAAQEDAGIVELEDATGKISYLRHSADLGASLRLGPIEPSHESLLLPFLPPLFYASIVVIVGLWLRPLLRDLDLITQATQRFASDYREPLTTAVGTTQLTVLARNLDEMSQRLSGLIQSQKELTAALSHEMRTPLARIRFALAVLNHEKSAELRSQIDEISADVQEIEGLIASILNYARLDHPDLRMNWQHTPFDAWLEQTLEQCRNPQRPLELVRGGVDESAWMDPRLMAIALSNLVANACRHARERVRLTVEGDATEYRLVVEDDGEGVPASERAAIFKAFTRLDTSRNRDTGGHGLGLAIVARIATLHGGSAGVDTSDALGGARFVLRWPVKDGELTPGVSRDGSV